VARLDLLHLEPLLGAFGNVYRQALAAVLLAAEVACVRSGTIGHDAASVFALTSSYVSFFSCVHQAGQCCKVLFKGRLDV
jgi:hypothetical protein